MVDNLNQPTRDERYTRYSGIIAPSFLRNAKVLIIGVGAVGRQVALQLAAMGVGSISMIDFDKVEELNLGPQGYRPDQVGHYKVNATSKDIKDINPQCKVMASTSKFTLSNAAMRLYDCVFSCVDCMDARKNIFTNTTEALTGVPPQVGIDVRMTAFAIQVYHVTDANRADYATTLFANEDAWQEPCTARSTIFTASIAAGLAITQWVQGLRGPLPLPFAQLLLDCWAMQPVDVQRPEDQAPADTAQPEPQTQTELQTH